MSEIAWAIGMPGVAIGIWTWTQANALLGAAIFFLFLAVLLIGIFAWQLSPRGYGYFPRYREWYYANPLRRISWRLGGVQVSNLPQKGAVVFEFSCQFRANRSGIRPKRFVLDFQGQTRVTPVLIQAETKTVTAEQIDMVPAGEWTHCSARILRDTNLPDDGRTNHPTIGEFNSLFGPFTLIFEHDDTTFRRRYGEFELKLMIDGQLSILSGAPSKVPTLKDDSSVTRQASQPGGSPQEGIPQALRREAQATPAGGTGRGEVRRE